MRLKLPSSEQWLYLLNVMADRLFFRKGFHTDIKTILIVKWDEIGDMATTTHVFKLLRNDYPDADITLLCKNFVKPLVVHDPHLDHIITDIAAFNQAYDLVVELRGTYSTLWRSIRYMAQYRTSRAEIRFKNKGRQLHEIATNTAVAASVTRAADPDQKPVLYYSETEKNNVATFLNNAGIKRYAVLHAGARRVLRQWPPDRFAAIALFLKETFELDIVFAGTEDEEAQINHIRQMTAFPTHLFTRGFSLSEFACLCSGAAVFVGNESGPLHIASSFGIPLIGLYGPGVPDVFYPTGDNSRVLHHVLRCNPCNQIDCVVPENPCIQRIMVLDVCNELLNLKDKINL